MLVGALALLPAVGGTFHVVLATEILINALFAVSFNLLFGYAGMLSFGQAAYFGIGAYATGLLLKRGGVASLAIGLLSGPAAAAIAALLLGFFCIRLTKVYFAMLTLAFAQVVFAITFKWYSFTGGDNGLIGIPLPPLDLLRIDLGTPARYYLFTLAVVSLALWACKTIVNSPFGCVMRALRENVERVEFVGLDVKRYQLGIFVLAGAFAGLAGALFALFQRQAFPDYLFWTRSAEPVLMTILGGIYTFLGPAVGAALLLILETTVKAYTEYWPIFLGATLLGLVLILPGGVTGTPLLRGLFARLDPAAAPPGAPR